jgi:hypothetical protein
MNIEIKNTVSVVSRIGDVGIEGVCSRGDSRSRRSLASIYTTVSHSKSHQQLPPDIAIETVILVT